MLEMISIFLNLLRLDFGEGNGIPLKYSCLGNPMDGGAWWAAVHGLSKSWTQFSDFTFTLTIMDRSTRKQTLNDAMDQLDLIDMYRTFHPKTMNFTFFSSARGTFSRIDHILSHKSSLGKFKKN